MAKTKTQSICPATPSSKPLKPNGVLASIQQKRWIYRHENEFRRALAGWAVSQHPFHKPPHLFEAVEDFVEFIALRHRGSLGVYRVHSTAIRKRIFEFCRSNRFTVRWNKPRRGKHTMVFTSLFNSVKPEYDFIDLDALAMNVARQILKDE